MTEAILRGYGPEIFGFLVSVHGTPSAAEDVFSDFAERLWRSLSTFDLRCSGRTWAYRIARNCSADAFRAPSRKREVPLDDVSRLSELALKVRTQTAEHLKTENKSALQALRDELDPDDRALLILRVDRELAWKDLARVFLEERLDTAVDDATLQRESARLRQRFQKLKRLLKERGQERGLL